MTETTTSARGSRRPAMLAAAAAVAAVTLAAGIALLSADHGDGPPRLDLSAGAPTAAGGGGRIAESSGVAADDMAGSSMMAWVRYEAGDELPDLGGSAPIHRLVGNDEDLRAVARHLGVEGAISDAEGGQRTIVDGDATVGRFGASWWYSSGQPYPGSDQVASAECDAEGTCSEPEPAPEPERPADLPTQAEAEAIVSDLAAAAGVDLTGARITSFDNITTWSVSIDLALDGTPVSGWSVYGTVMDGGQVLDAGGALGGLEHVGDYPLDTTRAAIDRMNEQSDVGPGGPEPAPAPGPPGEPAPAEAEATAAGDAEPDPAVQTEPAPDEMTIMPVEGEGQSEPIRVTLHGAELSYAMVGNADGTETYLVPAYLMDGQDDRGEPWSDVFAIAVQAEFLGA